MLDQVYRVAEATGIAGLGFHAYNILKRPGGVSWLNLFYAAPIGAPMALTLAGFFGRCALQVGGADGRSAMLFGVPAGRLLAAAASAGLAGTVGEAGLMHFRGAYHNPAMVLPVSLPPIAAGLLAATAAAPDRMPRRPVRAWLRLTAALGVAGVGFHAYGVSRNMGGWRNWSQNVLNGPPLPAPPSFTRSRARRAGGARADGRRTMRERYPGYDVLAKRNTPSWNEQTRRAIDARMAIDPDAHAFFTDEEWPTVQAVCERIIPQPPDRSHPAPLAAMVDAKLLAGEADGYRDARLPPQGEAWRRGVRALDAEALTRCGSRTFTRSTLPEQDEILNAVQEGKAQSDAWGDMPPALFFAKRLLHDVVGAYYAHPAAWNEIGFGGPASPRGYVRMNFDRRDPWEAAEARPGREDEARRENARVG